MKVCVFTIGCKVNQYESDSLIRALSEKGYEVTSSLEYCDAYIINTCAVTKEAERKSRQCISRVRSINRNAKIYITGCASELNYEQFEKKDGVKYISGSARKDRLEFFNELSGTDIAPISVSYEDYYLPQPMRTRGYIKVQDGCDNYCSYCIIPYLRGKSRSRGIESIVNEAKKLSESTNEIVLTGINLSSYGCDTGDSLSKLIKSLSGTARRLRIGSLEINIINEEFLDTLKSINEFAEHFHLSLQSGDDMVLKSMNRHYSARDYLDKVELIRNYFPYTAITTDIIAGFPTETEEAFHNTVNLVGNVKFSNIHCFPYSRREGTKAAEMKVLPKSIIDDRMDTLTKLRDRLRDEYNLQFTNKPLDVLIEGSMEGMSYGYSGNYIRVYTMDKEKEGNIINLIGEALYKDGLKGYKE